MSVFAYHDILSISNCASHRVALHPESCLYLPPLGFWSINYTLSYIFNFSFSTGCNPWNISSSLLNKSWFLLWVTMFPTVNLHFADTLVDNGGHVSQFYLMDVGENYLVRFCGKLHIKETNSTDKVFCPLLFLIFLPGMQKWRLELQ